MAKSEVELSLQFEQVRALGVHVWPLCLEHLVETLRLQRATGDGEVDKRHTGTQVWGKLNLCVWGGGGGGGEVGVGGRRERKWV